MCLRARKLRERHALGTAVDAEALAFDVVVRKSRALDAERRYRRPHVVKTLLICDEATARDELDVRRDASLADDRDVDPLRHHSVAPQDLDRFVRGQIGEDAAAVFGKQPEVARRRSVIRLIETKSKTHLVRQIFAQIALRKVPRLGSGLPEVRFEPLSLHGCMVT